MPTVKPRLAITLQPEQAAIVRRIARAHGVPQSRVVVDVVESVLPFLARAAEFAEKAEQLRGKGLSRQLVGALSRIESELAPLAHRTLREVDELLSEQARTRTARTQAQPAAGRATPVPSNHGGQVMPTPLPRPPRRTRPARG